LLCSSSPPASTASPRVLTPCSSVISAASELAAAAGAHLRSCVKCRQAVAAARELTHPPHAAAASARPSPNPAQVGAARRHKMPSKKSSKKEPEKKKAPPAPEKRQDPLFQATPRNFRVGGDIRPTRDLSRFVKWPRYVRLQRQRKILKERLKIPPALQQFKTTLDKNQATELLKLCMKYQPEDKAAKADRLKAIAEGGKKDDKAPHVIKFGLKHVTYLIESKKAKLVCIASDVDPVELVVWLPALCKKMDVPYCIVKDKSRLGTVTRQKTCAAVAFTSVRKEDQHSLDQLKSTFKAMYNDVTRHPWGGGIMGLKTQRKLEKREKALAEELAKRSQV
jgi:large subunit ribosomal protein L7Ae